ncbi:endonuclease III [Candidatus Dojkabacteria bacterium]|nr:endonuclease III [Candidatus Dojkabacteria bacterium]
MSKRDRALDILTKLEKHYPDLGNFLEHESAFQLLVATILSAQCTDKRVNKITPELFKYYPTPSKMAEADMEHLKKLIRSCGYYNSKAKNIKGTAVMLVKDFNSEVPGEIEELEKLPGVGRKTANVVLSQWFGKNKGIAVDTHVRRLSKVLGLTKHEDPSKIEKDLMKLFPRKKWNYISIALIQYGRDVCPARKHDKSKCWLGHFESK